MPPGPPHEERHVAAEEMARDLLTGAAEGLVLPFALVAGLAGTAVPDTAVATAGLAVLAAGAVATGLRHYLTERAAAERYARERRREEEETRLYPDRERWEVAAILHRHGVRGDALRLAVASVCADRRRWVDFMMRFELELEEPDLRRAAGAAARLAAAGAAAGLVPVWPFLLLPEGGPALLLSCLGTGVALLGLGWLRARVTGVRPLQGALQGVGIGALAAAAAWVVGWVAEG
jgi:VIT1/CCC1 family predicted Fe2+/Mn2+ transporter